jgi:hypothetical protein
MWASSMHALTITVILESLCFYSQALSPLAQILGILLSLFCSFDPIPGFFCTSGFFLGFFYTVGF